MVMEIMDNSEDENAKDFVSNSFNACKVKTRRTLRTRRSFRHLFGCCKGGKFSRRSSFMRLIDSFKVTICEAVSHS